MPSKTFSGENRGPLDPSEIAASDPLAKLANAPTFEPGIGRAAPDAGAKVVIPVIAAPEPTPPIEASPGPEVEMEETFQQDERGQWQKVMVPKGQVVVSFEAMDRYSPDPMGLGPDWDNSRGKEFHARWGNANPQHRTGEMQARFAPVLAENVPPAVRNRYLVSDKVPGFEGLKCLVFGDAVLLEKPKVLFEAGYAHAVATRRRLTGQMENQGDPARGIENLSNSMVGPVGSESRGGVDTSDPRKMMAEATAEAEAVAFRQTQETAANPIFGGFQGNPAYNNTSWGTR